MAEDEKEKQYWISPDFTVHMGDKSFEVTSWFYYYRIIQAPCIRYINKKPVVCMDFTPIKYRLVNSSEDGQIRYLELVNCNNKFYTSHLKNKVMAHEVVADIIVDEDGYFYYEDYEEASRMCSECNAVVHNAISNKRRTK